MNTQLTQEARRRLKLQLLQWRINNTMSRLSSTHVSDPRCRKLYGKLVTLVERRNNLRTPGEVSQLEKARGLA